MSVANKSLDKNKRFVGVKANDFGKKPGTNEANRSAIRPQGWANLGKINSRRVPPPANLPSLKSEIGVSSPTFDPTVAPNHGWTSNDNQTPVNSIPNPTQQQLDSLPVNSSTPPPPQPLMDIDKPRTAPTWSTKTAGGIPNEKIPSLLPLNDFPHLATSQDRKSQTESIANTQSPSFRPANLATWKEGGGSRMQPLPNDMSQMMPSSPGANLYQQQMPNPNMRMYPPQMWAYNPYPPMPLSMPQHQHMNAMHEYKSPTILRNKDIEDLSKITDNTWANSNQEVNYDEKLRFSDDDDHENRIEILDKSNKTRRINTQVLQHSRLIRDDEHLKQMQDDKNSELINALTVAKQRRDEQERHLKNEQLSSNTDEQKQIPGYQTRPLLNANDQENSNTSSSFWQTTTKDTSNTSRTRHDTPNSQSSFAMKSWSDQMDSVNHVPLHENDSSSQSHPTHESQTRKLRKTPITSKRQTKVSTKKTNKTENKNYHDNQAINSNDQWDNWDESVDNRYQSYGNENRHHQQVPSDGLSTQKSNRFNKPSSAKTRTNERQQTNSRIKSTSSASNMKPNQSINTKTQPVWRPLSPSRPSDGSDPTPQESITFKSQQRTNVNENKQRYQTTTTPLIDTSSIPPLMSVRSDATTANLYKAANHNVSSHYNDENAYYDSNLDQNYHHTNLHNRRYTTLGTFGRYRRTGTTRHQQQYTNYNLSNTSGISSAPNTSSGTRQKKNSNNKKSIQSSEPVKPLMTDEIPPVKPIEPPLFSSTSEVLPIDVEKSNDTSEKKTPIKNENESNVAVSFTENDTTKTSKKTKIVTASNLKRNANKNQQNYHQDQHYQNQQAPRHRNNYSRSMQEYDAMQMAAAHNYYGTNRRPTHNGRHTQMHDLSGGYYYEHTKQTYNNRYNYSHEGYQQQQHSANKNSKRGGSTTIKNRQQKQQTVNGSNNNNNNNFRHHSMSDNDQKEGEEWETASESSTNMRNDQYDTNAINIEQTNDTRSNHRGRTPPKKSFSSQRPNAHARQIFKYTNA